MTPKPGYQTTEFWIAIVSQLLALLMIAGVITPQDKTTLEGALSSLVAAIATIVASAWVVIRYIDARYNLKLTGAEPTDSDDQPPTILPLAPLALLAVLFLPAVASAQPPQTKDACLFGRHRAEPRQQVPQTDPALLQALDQLAANQQALIAQLQRQPQYQPPQIIVLGGPPYQNIPLGGPPLQQIPIGGPPKQDVPLGGPPIQQVPIGGPPKQEIPLGGPSKELFPPPQPAQPPVQPKPPTAYQRYSLWR